MPNNREHAIKYSQDHHDTFVNDLVEFSSIPSVSTNPELADRVLETAEWLAGKLGDAGLMNVQIKPTGGYPVVYGEFLQAGNDKPTILIYGHYDVQPAEPLSKWHNPPFSPVIQDENLYARGATDMKGPVMATIDAVKSITTTTSLPINVKFIIEGEEEVGSPNLGNFIETNKELLSCDVALNPDTGMHAPDIPTITYALRGLAYFELRLYGPSNDLHSGVFGGVVNNPAQVLTELIAGMHDENGSITLPGFYDKVRDISDEERAELAKFPINDDFFLEKSGAPALWGESEFTPVERTGARPTLEVNGILSGFTGEGSKTVLPAKAMAKLSCRLVPDQTPEEVHNQLVAYLNENAPKTVRWELDQLAGNVASISDRNSKWVQAYKDAAEAVWGVKPVFKREGGSVPVVVDFQQILGVDSVNIGFSLPGDNMHGPNEKFHLPTFFKGIEAVIHFIFNLVE